MFCKCCNLPKSKVCNTCHAEKPANHFAPERKQCKDCRSAYNARRYIARKEAQEAMHPNALAVAAALIVNEENKENI